jgi:outer membrane receptor protein involved in Fe transport
VLVDAEEVDPQEQRGRVRWCKLEPDALREAGTWMKAFGLMDSIDLDAFERFLARELSDDAKLSLTAGYSWIDSFSLGTFGTLNDIQPSYGLLDASAALNYKGYFLRVAGKNLTNKDYRTQSLPTVFFQGWAAPATVTVSVGAKF